MITIRRSNHRGRSKTDWLNSYHTFSFADYYEQQWMGFGSLRVINEDFIKPSSGFAMHSHQDMEIITYVVDGALSHKDNMGHGSIIRRGEIQRMSAGTGVRHSEFNASNTDELHLLQIWIIPETTGTQPNYEQKQILIIPDQLILIGSPRGEMNSVTIHQRINLYAGYLTQGSMLSHQLENRQCWLQLINGSIQLNEQLLDQGDGIAINEEKQITVHCMEKAEILLFELF